MLLEHPRTLSLAWSHTSLLLRNISEVTFIESASFDQRLSGPKSFMTVEVAPRRWICEAISHKDVDTILVGLLITTFKRSGVFPITLRVLNSRSLDC